MRLVTFLPRRAKAARLGALLDNTELLDLTTPVARPAFSSLLALIEAGEDAGHMRGRWSIARLRSIAFGATKCS
jgi:hypothetical protein